MNILGVTLARGGSKGVPNKHIRNLGGKSVLAWTIEAALRSRLLNEYVVSSDNNKILDVASLYKNVFVIRRPSELARDDTPTLPALQHAVKQAEEEFRKQYDYIIEIRATSPFKTTDDIDGMIERLLHSGADSVIGVTALEDHHPARAKWLTPEGYIRDFVPEPSTGRRQDFIRKAYVRNGTVYALKRESVMGKDARLFGHARSIGYVMPAERSVNIDTELDFTIAELLAERRGR